MRRMSPPRSTLTLALLGGVFLLAACGVDPPPAAGEGAPAAAAEAPAPKGVALTPREDLTASSANGTVARCNIETLGGHSLESVHPAIAAGGAVKVAGWYALPAAPAAVPTPAPEAAADAGAAAPAAESAPAAAAPPMLVIANENGVNHWVVPLPALRQRRDVAKAFDDPALGLSGFEVELDLTSLKPGFYGIHLSDGAHSPESVCGLGRGFVIQ